MLILAAICAVVGFLLAYAGIRGVYWPYPWRLIVTVAKPKGATTKGAAAPAGAGVELA